MGHIGTMTRGTTSVSRLKASQETAQKGHTCDTYGTCETYTGHTGTMTRGATSVTRLWRACLAAPAQTKQVSKETHLRGKRDLLYAYF